jgi:hypothetical protein
MQGKHMKSADPHWHMGAQVLQPPMGMMPGPGMTGGRLMPMGMQPLPPMPPMPLQPGMQMAGQQQQQQLDANGPASADRWPGHGAPLLLGF